MKDLKVDDNNQLLGLQCHDALLSVIDISTSSLIKIGITRKSGDEIRMSLRYVRYFLVNNFREGNVIDRMYLWDVSHLPANIEARVMRNFNVESISALMEDRKDTLIFLLESSYGAEIFAVISSTFNRADYLEQVQVEYITVTES